MPASIQKIKRFLQSATARLAVSYLAIIMLMSIGFSVVFFNASIHEFDRRPLPETNQSQSLQDHQRVDHDPAVEAYLEQRADEARHSLLNRLILLNLIALAGGGALSYYLARRTLQPIEQNMEAQAQFVSDASHELRTPLTVLQTTNEVALRKPKITQAGARDLLAHNVAEVTKLQALTTALLKLAKPDGSDIKHVPVSLQSAASEAMNTLIPAAQAKGATIEDSVPDIAVLGDQAGITQAIAILLDNAIKYSAHGGVIKLSGSRSGRTGMVSVIDTGQGIAAKDLPHVFDRFYRADQSRGKNRVDGYGIGLSLAKKLVHQMNGEIVATSAVGKGSTFSIKLPLA